MDIYHKNPMVNRSDPFIIIIIIIIFFGGGGQIKGTLSGKWMYKFVLVNSQKSMYFKDTLLNYI